MMIYAVRELYEKELVHLGKFISPGMIVVDAGANCGIYTVAAARLVGPTGRVLSFEPGMQSFSALQKNVQLNRLQNVTTFRAALADKEGIARLYHAGRGPTSFTLAPVAQNSANWEEVTTQALRNVLQEEKAEQVGFIKLDVEGAEELVLRGAEPVLARYHPTIVFEMNSGTARGLGLSPVGAWNLLEHFGYRFFSLTGLGDLREMDQPPPEDECMNLVAVHHERANEDPNHWPRL
jgi:FkbM family methyltransferase